MFLEFPERFLSLSPLLSQGTRIQDLELEPHASIVFWGPPTPPEHVITETGMVPPMFNSEARKIAKAPGPMPCNPIEASDCGQTWQHERIKHAHTYRDSLYTWSMRKQWAFPTLVVFYCPSGCFLSADLRRQQRHEWHTIALWGALSRTVWIGRRWRGPPNMHDLTYNPHYLNFL